MNGIGFTFKKNSLPFLLNELLVNCDLEAFGDGEDGREDDDRDDVVGDATPRVRALKVGQVVIS